MNCFRYIAEISTTRKVLTPTNGYLNYTEGTSMQEIFTKTIDNSRPEQDTAYIVKLIGIKAPGQLADPGKIESRLTSKLCLSSENQSSVQIISVSNRDLNLCP